MQPLHDSIVACHLNSALNMLNLHSSAIIDMDCIPYEIIAFTTYTARLLEIVAASFTLAPHLHCKNDRDRKWSEIQVSKTLLCSGCSWDVVPGDCQATWAGGVSSLSNLSLPCGRTVSRAGLQMWDIRCGKQALL
jgi:hypothetical protein